MKTNPIPENIGEYLELNEDSPSGLIWKKKPSRKTIVGSVAGSFNKSNKRWQIRFKRKLYYCYRVVFYLRTGVKPDGLCIDHATHKTETNNDLRLCSHSDNMNNHSIHRHNTSGYRGVSLDKRSGKWCAYIWIKNKKKALGNYFTKEEAARAFNVAALEYRGKFACLNPV